MNVKPVLWILALLALNSVANGQSTEAEFEALMKQRNAAAVETLARQRLQTMPTDDMALWAWGRVVAGDPVKRAEVLPRAETCVWSVRSRPVVIMCSLASTARWPCGPVSPTA